MYRLTYFKAENVVGFISGLGKRKFELDLSSMKNKNILVIIGSNATGKSTFMSLIHPSHTPSDNRSKFIVPGKEGQLIRRYEGDDGTVINTLCIYQPKTDGGHTAKCYFSVKKATDKEFIELNGTGNVTSYTNLLNTYFGITKDYISFASYSDAVTDIVTMTDTERKNNVSSLIPNTKRFEVAYNTINDKYKELRNLIRNVSQKILMLRNDDALNADLKRVRKELSAAEEQLEEYLKKRAKAEGRVRELSQGNDIHQMIEQYQEMVHNIEQRDDTLKSIHMQLKSLYKKLNLTADDDMVTFKGSDKLSKLISSYERKIASSKTIIESNATRMSELRSTISQLDTQIEEQEALLYSMETQDLDQLINVLHQYEEQLKTLRYQKQSQYDNLTYDGAVSLSRVIALWDNTIQALYDEYGEMVSVYFQHVAEHIEMKPKNTGVLEATIETKTAKRDQIYREILEKEQYRKFQSILNQRPKSCQIDSCPFIAEALKWKGIMKELDELKAIYQKLGVEIASHQKELDDVLKESALREHAQQLVQQIQTYADILDAYLHVSITDVYKSIASGMWETTLDILKLKSIAAILSEKDLYFKLSNELIPQVKSSIELAKASDASKEIIRSQLQLNEESKKRMEATLKDLKRSRKCSEVMSQSYQNCLSRLQRVALLLAQYREIAMKQESDVKEVNEKQSQINSIQELVEKCMKYDQEIDSARAAIRELTPEKQQLEMDIANLHALQIEKAEIEHSFLIVDIMRSILMPGKGIRKELINIYMYDIYQIANQLLLNTFDGKLYLKEFIITDKEFVIPYVYNGMEGSDIAYASSSQQSTIAIALSLAILSKLIDRYGVLTIDEADKALSPENKAVFIDILTKQIRYISVSQCFIITHSPEFYESYDTGFIAFPGAKFNRKGNEYIEV